MNACLGAQPFWIWQVLMQPLGNPLIDCFVQSKQTIANVIGYRSAFTFDVIVLTKQLIDTYTLSTSDLCILSGGYIAPETASVEAEAPMTTYASAPPIHSQC